ncbi:MULTISPECIES: hypothetical protein [unclassified Saccharopolyspora]|uniref:hypothetical protein n=1 Tax=unclassified Saccharopolyspora TaxID=2646250 RepID=UPI001CD7DCB4|nr:MULTISPECIES: hypothetical protein [unclassified Saccharopolyspora]MCA1185148.1 hypothetical protein [Saccharopolyspora sp. 6T]MCA1191376.1 hypothetical protein [Saccharopolyspora sp. 6V]MCA1278486.1 hypothetical protein [Saccharopolyspora sp. 7B]
MDVLHGAYASGPSEIRVWFGEQFRGRPHGTHQLGEVTCSGPQPGANGVTPGIERGGASTLPQQIGGEEDFGNWRTRDGDPRSEEIVRRKMDTKHG